MRCPELLVVMFSSMQFFPWLEVVVRYTEENYKPYHPGSSQSHKDKGLDLKIKLFSESEKMPAIALGIGDLGGTGQFSREFLVANKKINNFDFSLGLGWGKFGGSEQIKNPFMLLHDSFENRATAIGFGGAIDIGQYFSGKYASFFGGIEYFTPIENLSVKFEYDPTYYAPLIGKEKNFLQTGDPFEVDSRYNIGLHYRYKPSTRDNLDLTLGYVRGNTIFATFALHSNFNDAGKNKYIAPKETLKLATLDPFNELSEDWKKYLTELIIWQMGNEGIITHNVIFNGNELRAEISQARFLRPIQAIDLASRILANNSPKNIKTITIINIDQGIETLRGSIDRDTLFQVVAKGPLTEEFVDFNNENPLLPSSIKRSNDYLYPHFGWQIKPHLSGTIQHQINFYFWQLEALIHTEYSIKKGLYINSDIGIGIVDNFDEYTWHIADGELHHVRQDRRLYLTEGKTGIRRLAVDYFLEINKNIKAYFALGYLEWMFGGAGGQVLYKKEQKPWALGLEAYWVKQREFDQKFSFRDYETVTGFLNFYYDIPFYDLRLKSSLGKFLGKDNGITVDVSRRFETGARVGAKVALTNCDATCVGEGSFNKWIYFELPMNLLYVNSTTRNKSGFSWSPLTKDAGTQLGVGSLYDLTVDASDQVEFIRKKPWSISKIFSGFSTSPNKTI